MRLTLGLLLLPLVALGQGAVSDVTGADGISSSSTFTISYPTTVNEGETLLLILSTDSSDAITLDAAWDIALVTNTVLSTATCNVHAARADGTEGGTSTTATVAAGEEEFAYIVYALSGLANPDTTAPEATISGTTTDANPDPPSETHSNGSADYYVAATFCGDANAATQVDTFPSGYSDSQQQQTNTGQAMVGAALNNVTSTDTEDPGTFTIDASDEWRATTIMFLVEDDASILRRIR